MMDKNQKIGLGIIAGVGGLFLLSARQNANDEGFAGAGGGGWFGDLPTGGGSNLSEGTPTTNFNIGDLFGASSLPSSQLNENIVLDASTVGTKKSNLDIATASVNQDFASGVIDSGYTTSSGIMVGTKKGEVVGGYDPNLGQSLTAQGTKDIMDNPFYNANVQPKKSSGGGGSSSGRHTVSTKRYSTGNLKSSIQKNSSKTSQSKKIKKISWG